MNHLEELVYQWYSWRGYVVKRNIKVGRLKRGGFEGELDIVALHLREKRVLHVEPSVDADDWKAREARYERKFACGRKYIYEDVFPGLEAETAPLHQIAILASSPKDRDTLAGGQIQTIDGLMAEIAEEVGKQCPMISNAVPEQYHLLRTVQLFKCGYQKKPK